MAVHAPRQVQVEEFAGPNQLYIRQKDSKFCFIPARIRSYKELPLPKMTPKTIRSLHRDGLDASQDTRMNSSRPC